MPDRDAHPERPGESVPDHGPTSDQPLAREHAQRPMPTPAETDVEEPDETLVPRVGNRRAWTLSLLALVPLVAVLVWIGLGNARDVVTPRVLGYHVVDARSVVVDVEIERPQGKAVTCEVEALDVRFAPVGAIRLDVPAGPAVVRQEITVRTSSEATTGTVKACRVA